VNKAVFLDRDGVINRAVFSDGMMRAPATADGLELFPGVVEATAALHEAGFRLIVATNQPDVATGRTTQAEVEAIHARLRVLLPLDDIRVCYHVDADRCDCRKPKPGMLLAAARDWEIDLAASIMVGDRWRDVGAGRAAGCRTILIESGYDDQAATGYDAAAPSLLAASQLILATIHDTGARPRLPEGPDA
jgi:D-glycero-D-manno-heptose 1,7-bisphosphate phosphatase